MSLRPCLHAHPREPRSSARAQGTGKIPPCRPFQHRVPEADPEFNLAACLAGDKVAWDAFVERFAGVVYSAVRRTIGGRPSVALDGDDLVQDVFLRLVKDDCRLLRCFDSSRASLSTWLALVARSVAIDHMRRRRVETATLDPEAAAAPRAVAPGAGAGAAAGAGGIEDAAVPWHQLTTRQRLVLRMLFDQEMTVEHVAALIGVDAQTVRSTKHKALTRLREAMKEGCTGTGDRM